MLSILCLCTYRSTRTQLLLWPSHPLSPSARLHSPVLSHLIFTTHTGIAYAHTTQRVFPLKTSAATSAELTKISSTVSDHAKQNEKNDGLGSMGKTLSNGSGIQDSLKSSVSDSLCDNRKELGVDEEKSKNDVDHSKGLETERGSTARQRSFECQPYGVYHCVYTELPKFLVTFTPKVGMHVDVGVFMCMYIYPAG